MITHTDTLVNNGIVPVSKAFVSGKLLMPDNPIVTDAIVSVGWNQYALNYCGVILCLIGVVILLRRIINIYPRLFKGIFRCKELLNIENSMSLVRERNSLVPLGLLTLCLIVSKYGLYSPNFLTIFNLGVRTYIVLCILLFYSMFRFFIMLGVATKLDSDTHFISNRIGSDFIIISSVVLLISVLLFSVIGLSFEIIRIVLLYEILIIYLIFLIRRLQILLNICSQLSAILYLCVLEIIPAFLLVASEIFL